MPTRAWAGGIVNDSPGESDGQNMQQIKKARSSPITARITIGITVESLRADSGKTAGVTDATINGAEKVAPKRDRALRDG